MNPATGEAPASANQWHPPANEWHRDQRTVTVNDLPAVTVTGQQYGRTPTELPPGAAQGVWPVPRQAEKVLGERQLAGINALRSLADATAVTQGFQAIPLAPPAKPPAEKSGPRLLGILKDPALQGALALITSAVASGGLGFVFWALNAHYQNPAAVGDVSAEVSAITFLANVGSLNLINVFARFLPEAGWHARRMVLISYAGAVLTGSLAAIIFLFTPLATGLILGGSVGRLAFIAMTVICSVFLIQDGGLVGFGRAGWVPVENVAVASVRLALLPLAALFLSVRIGILWSWALPMVASVMVVNTFIIGRLSRRQTQRPKLPPVRELTQFIAIESVTTAVSSAASAFLPALVTRQLGATQGGYFYVPWIITSMVGLLLTSILISMVREAVARPEKAGATIRRSLGLITVALVAGMIGCLLLPDVVLTPLGPAYVTYGAPLLRWTGLALPAVAVNFTFWSTCLTRRRPWPVFAMNLALSVGLIGGVATLGHGADIGKVGMVYCLVQWAIAVVVAIPTYKALRVIQNGGSEK